MDKLVDYADILLLIQKKELYENWVKLMVSNLSLIKTEQTELKVEIISKTNKWLNATSYVALITGVVAILCTAKVATEAWALFTIVLVVAGLLSLIIGWVIGKRNSINISIEEISRLIVNAESEEYLSKKAGELNYLGNWITLKNGNKYEINRKHIIELALKLDCNQIEVHSSKDRFYSTSPIEVLKELINLGP